MQISGKVDGNEVRDARAEKQTEQVTVPDARVRQLKDQLIRAKVYLSLPATKGNAHFVRELRLRIKEVQRVLGDASKDSDLPKTYCFFLQKAISISSLSNFLFLFSSPLKCKFDFSYIP